MSKHRELPRQKKRVRYCRESLLLPCLVTVLLISVGVIQVFIRPRALFSIEILLFVVLFPNFLHLIILIIRRLLITVRFFLGVIVVLVPTTRMVMMLCVPNILDLILFLKPFDLCLMTQQIDLVQLGSHRLHQSRQRPGQVEEYSL